MARKNANGNDAPVTTAQKLGSLLKAARNIMRKDKGLNGDLDRLPLLTWIMFLKFLDDLELQREEEAPLARKKFRPAVEPPYRWRDWAADRQGITGDALLSFINQDETRRPDGTRGAGLLPCQKTRPRSSAPATTLRRRTSCRSSGLPVMAASS
jgi:type I restriction enzyme M protein